MSVAFRLSIPIVATMTLSACASAPVPRPGVVAVDAGVLSPAYSSFNARVLSDAGTLDSTFVASLNRNVESLTRLESTYTQQVGDEHLRMGDTVSSSGMWGTSLRYAGVQFGTPAGTRDDVITSTRLATSGLAVLPTVADALFASADASASLEHQNLSVDRSLGGRGPNAWTLVAQDSLGRSQQIDAPMIASTRLAEPGCSDFSVGFGRVRRDYAILSNAYGPAFANSTVVCGAPLGFTVEGHGEYLADAVAAFGIGLARRLGPMGTASIAFASSRADIGSGWLARVGFEHENSLFSLMLRSRIQNAEFREIGTSLREDPIMERNLASIGVHVAEGANLSLAYATQVTWARDRTNLLALKQRLSLGRGSLSMTAGHSLEDNFGSSLFISYKRPFGAIPFTRSAVEEFDLDLLGAGQVTGD